MFRLNQGLYWFRRGFRSPDSHPRTVTAYQNGLKYKRRRLSVSVRSISCCRSWVAHSLGYRHYELWGTLPPKLWGRRGIMKLPRAWARCRAHAWGNQSTATVMEEVLVEEFSDRGSTPLSSIIKWIKNGIFNCLVNWLFLCSVIAQGKLLCCCGRLFILADFWKSRGRFWGLRAMLCTHIGKTIKKCLCALMVKRYVPVTHYLLKISLCVRITKRRLYLRPLFCMYFFEL